MPKKPQYRIIPAPVGDPAEAWMQKAQKLIPEGLRVVMITCMEHSDGQMIGAKSNMDLGTAVTVMERAMVAMRAQTARGKG